MIENRWCGQLENFVKHRAVLRRIRNIGQCHREAVFIVVCPYLFRQLNPERQTALTDSHFRTCRMGFASDIRNSHIYQILVQRRVLFYGSHLLGGEGNGEASSGICLRLTAHDSLRLQIGHIIGTEPWERSFTADGILNNCIFDRITGQSLCKTLYGNGLPCFYQIFGRFHPHLESRTLVLLHPDIGSPYPLFRCFHMERVAARQAALRQLEGAVKRAEIISGYLLLSNQLMIHIPQIHYEFLPLN